MSRPHSSAGDDLEVSAGERRTKSRRSQTLQFFTVAETAEMLRVSTRTVRRWIDRGDLIAHRPGGVVRIAEDDLRTFLALHREG
jgi:excisionase family DNA binding protein